MSWVLGERLIGLAMGGRYRQDVLGDKGQLPILVTNSVTTIMTPVTRLVTCHVVPRTHSQSLESE